MIDPIRDLLISLALHMAYMQGQLEARHELDDPEDYYWYRESVLLRQKVTDALADEPAVPQGREPASVTGQPSDEELGLIYHDFCRGCEFMDQVGFEDAARAVLTRWGNPAPQLPTDGEVAEVMGLFRHWAEAYPDSVTVDPYWLTRAADLLQRLSPPQPVPVSERPWEREGWCDKRGMCWAWNWGICNWWEWVDSKLISYSSEDYTHCLPAHALPIPSVEKSK
jgi:hypothetical protein